VARGVAWAAGAQAVIAIADLVSQLLVFALFLPKTMSARHLARLRSSPRSTTWPISA